MIQEHYTNITETLHKPRRRQGPGRCSFKTDVSPLSISQMVKQAEIRISNISIFGKAADNFYLFMFYIYF